MSPEPQIPQREIDLVGVALARIAGADKITPPGDTHFQAIVLIGQAKARAQRFEAVRREGRIFGAVGQVEHAGTEHRPVAREGDAARDAQFLAVLKVDGKGLKPVRLGTTGDLMIGEAAIAVGNPFGLSNTVTTGIVSALQRTVQGETRTYTDFIQTDAAINPGNSGGALCNVLGELIGINTAIVGGANTIGFAIPVERVRRIVDDLLRFGEVKPVWVGVRGTTVTPERGRPSSRGLGMRVRSVYPASPAEEAGLEPGDVVVSLNGRPVESREDFDTLLASVPPGQSVSLEARRSGELRKLSLAVARAPEDLGLEVLRREIGISVAQARGGLFVTSVARESPADRKGLERGDVLVAVNGRRVSTLEDVARAVERGYGRSGLVLVVGRGGYAYTLTFGLE